MCENCKNKDVCKWVDDVNKIKEYDKNRDEKSPVKINLICQRKRV